MKLRFSEKVENPIATGEDYTAEMRHARDLRQHWHTLSAAGDPRSVAARRGYTAFVFNFRKRLPYVLVSRCPYCDAPVWEQVGVFSLADPYWFNSGGSGRVGSEELGTLCPHLFCVDGALNLNGRQPTEAVHGAAKITMAAEVPFVKPRVLNLPTMVAVVHSFPVADRYTAYAITYFCTEHPPQKAFCIPWARREYFDDDQELPGGNYTGRRSDVQAYDLRSWIERGKLFWLAPDEEDGPVVRGDAEDFPYHDVPGRRHPYIIDNGKVRDRPDPVETRPRIETEFF